MKTGLSGSFCLIVCFLVCSSETPTNIRPEKIKAVLGQDVILPCKAPNNINIKAVEWIRPDQEPEYVLFYRNKRLHPENQHPSYKNRTDLQDKDMKDGDVSLILKNVIMDDTGTYKCQVFEQGKKYPISFTDLEVHLSGNKEGISGDRGEKNGGNKDRVIVVPVVIMSLLLLLWLLVF